LVYSLTEKPREESNARYVRPGVLDAIVLAAVVALNAVFGNRSCHMGWDIRTPFGLMFSVFGVIVTSCGFISDRVMYARWRGKNINLVWGLALLAFGDAMFLLGMRRPRASVEREKQ
jgi:hypothetical protein